MLFASMTLVFLQCLKCFLPTKTHPFLSEFRNYHLCPHRFDSPAIRTLHTLIYLGVIQPWLSPESGLCVLSHTQPGCVIPCLSFTYVFSSLCVSIGSQATPSIQRIPYVFYRTREVLQAHCLPFMDNSESCVSIILLM